MTERPLPFCAIDFGTSNSAIAIATQRGGRRPVPLEGGSTGLCPLTERLAAALPEARAVRGDRLASVATGLGLHARRRFGGGS